MKPIKLTLQAFGSYGEETVIDFSKPTENLFLISGNTGSGKSTIFDAIMFALYGESSSALNKKDGVELKSNFVDIKTKSYVELTFEEKGQIFTVKRSPKQLRPQKKRERNEKGELVQKLTEDKQQVELILPGGVSSGLRTIKEINDKIVDLIGLTSDQFRNVGMLAQGEFMKVLRATKEEKTTVYRKLFGTHVFDNIVKELKNRKKMQEEEIKELQTKCEERLNFIEISNDDEDFAEIQDLQTRLKSDLTIEDMNQLYETLERMIGRLQRELEENDLKKQETMNLRDKAIHDKNVANALFQKIDELQNAEAARRKLCEQQETYDLKAQLIRDIDDAYEIQGVYKLFVNAKMIVEEEEGQLAKNKENLPIFNKRVEDAKKSEEEATDDYNSRLNGYTIVKERVERALRLFEELVKLSDDLKSKNGEHVATQKALETTEKRVQELDANVKEWTKIISEKKDAGANYEALWAKKNSLESIKKEIENARKDEQNIVDCERKRREAADNHQKLTRRAEDAKIAHQKTLMIYIDEQAVFLADQLEEGKPCPVCGSIHHPSPRVKSVDIRELTWDKVASLAKEYEKCDKAEKDAKEELQKADVNLDHARNILKKDRESIREKVGFIDLAPDFTLDEADAALSLETKRVQDELSVCEKDKIIFNDAQQKIESSEEQKRKLLNDKEQAQNKANQAANAVVAANAALTEKERLFKELGFDSRDAANDALKIAETQKNEAETRLSNAKSVAKEAEKNKTECDSGINRLLDSLPKKREELAKATQEYRNKLDAKELDEETWIKITSKYKKDERSALQVELDRFNAYKARTNALCEQLGKEVEGKVVPDLEMLEKAIQDANVAYEKAEDSVNNIKRVIENNQKAANGLKGIREQFEPTIKLYSLYRGLYQRFAGTAKASALEMRALRVYLEQILKATNQRLYKLSDQRYEFRLNPWKVGVDNIDNALDLLVFDYDNNKAREVGTLSGGESFMAAMAMALGTSDVVQSKTAGVRLDVMFIDEGFGSLDPERLNEAITVVKKCAGGNKLVGIISHVEGLKREIDDQLIVEYDKRTGSRVKWVNG